MHPLPRSSPSYFPTVNKQNETITQPLINLVVLLTCPFQTGHHLGTEGDRATEWKHWDGSVWWFRWLEKCCTCALVRTELPHAVVAERLLGLDGVPGGVGLEWPGDPRDVGHLGGRASQRGRPTLQQELSVVDDPGACRSEKPTHKVTMNEMKVMMKKKKVLVL